jgi:hypothetical protein
VWAFSCGQRLSEYGLKFHKKTNPQGFGKYLAIDNSDRKKKAPRIKRGF